MKRRILSLVLACMLLSGPLTARAADLPSVAEDRYTLGTNGETYALSGNITNGVEVTGKNVTLELGGYSIAPDVGSAIVVKEGASATITGTGTAHGKGASAAALVVEPNAACTVQGGSYLAEQYYTIRNYGKLTITGGEFRGSVFEHDPNSAYDISDDVSVAGGVFSAAPQGVGQGKAVVALNHLTYLYGVTDTPTVTVTPADTAKAYDGAGVTLTAAASPATVSAYYGKDYDVNYAYSWKRGADVISGAVGNVYTTSPDVTVGSVAYTAYARTNDADYTGSAKVTITATSAPALTGTVTVSGTAKVGQTLTANLGSDTNNTGTLSYQWKADGAAISGARSKTYKLTGAELGKKMSCEITSSVQTGSRTGAMTAAGAAADPTPPELRIYLNHTWLDLYPGDYGTLSATVSPASAASSITWRTNDRWVVSVDSAGRYFADQRGNATITATVTRGGQTRSASCYVRVLEPGDGRGNSVGTYTPNAVPANQQNGQAAQPNRSGIDQNIHTTTNADGSKQTVINQPDGTSSVLITDGIGMVKSASVTYSSSAVSSASWGGGMLSFPGKVLPASNPDSAPELRIVLPPSSQRVRIKVPVSYMTPCTVAVVENAFGPDKVLHSSSAQSDGVTFSLDGSSVVKIVDKTKDFYDVSGSEWFAKSVEWASSHEIMNGVSEHMFDPNGAMSRAMMTQIIYNYAGADAANVTDAFSDVSRNDWYGKSVTWASGSGIAHISGDSFGAEDGLAREDMASMLFNYAKMKGYSTYISGSTASFADDREISDWARPAMAWAVGNGLIRGTQNGTRAVVLDPKGTANRAQLTTIMMRFNELYEN